MIALLLLSQTLFSQEYPALGRKVVEVPDSYSKMLQLGTDEGVKAYVGEHEKKLKEIYEYRDNSLLSYYESGLFLTEPYWKDHIDQILARIATANPSYGVEELEVYYTLQPSVNAISFGQGLIIVHLGLLQAVESEDELAFVLCHEIAHQYLSHSNVKLHDRVNEVYSKEFKKKVKTLKKQEFNKLDSLRDWSLDMSFESARHTRYGEREADSLGLVLYQATTYASDGPVGAMEVLAKADTCSYTSPLKFSRLLHTPDVPFKARWSYKAPPSPFSPVYTLTQAERDSLRSHPDTDERKAWLEATLKIKPPSNELSDDLIARKREASKAFVVSYFNFGQVGHSLYASLRMIETQDSLWAKGIAALSLYRLAIAREQRHFTEVARLPRERTYDAGQEELLRILHTMRMKELKALAAAYAKTHADDFSTCGEELALARVLTSSLGEESPADRSRLQADFKKAFPNSTYTSILRSKDDPWADSNND